MKYDGIIKELEERFKAIEKRVNALKRKTDELIEEIRRQQE